MMSVNDISFQLSYLQSTVGLSPFNTAAFRYGIERNLLLAVASRESHMGRLLDANYLGDHGNGMGIMQIDRRYHPEFAMQIHPGDHTANIQKGAEILREELNRFNGDVYAALAAYNSGAGNVQRAIRYGLDPDYYTTGKDYAKDVLHRYEIINQLAEPTVADVASIDAVKFALLVSAAAGMAFYMYRN